MEPTDFEYGERQYTAKTGRSQWTFSETLDDVAPEAWVGFSYPLGR